MENTIKASVMLYTNDKVQEVVLGDINTSEDIAEQIQSLLEDKKSKLDDAILSIKKS